jgi:SAM-dependent methyltransferase
MEQETYRRMAEIQEKHWWYEARRQIIAAVLGKLKLPASAEILEVGCGPGANLKMLAKFGKVTGVEPDDFSIEHARKVSGCRVEKGFLPDDLRVSGPFDLIGAFDVIEHVGPDLESLKTIHALTRQGGYALFTVPAYMFLWSQHDVVNHHKRRYILPQFRALLKQAGFEVSYISYYNTLLFPLIAGVRMVKKLLKLKEAPDDTIPGVAFVNESLRGIFALERHIIGCGCFSLPFGVSVIALCRKS